MTGVPHILVVDDELDLAILVQQKFRKQIKGGSYTFSFVNNGREALEKLKEDPSIHIVMTDINMPIMDGLTLLNEIKLIERPLKTIVASAYSDLVNIRTAMNRGAFDFVTKPIDFADLEATIEKTIEELRLLLDGKEAQSRLHEAMLDKEHALQSASFKQQFLANMSHEIRTPLNAVIGMTNLLIDKEPREDQVRYLNSMRLASHNLLHIINDILDISKIEAGKISFEELDFNLNEVVDNVYQTLHHKAEEKNIGFGFSIDEKLPTWIKGDPTRLAQIIINLTGNALKFTDIGGKVSIRCSSEAHPDDNTVSIRFEIEDTGIGISQDQISKIFDSFTQASNETTRKYGGTGLGLAISKQLVELQNGTMNVTSTEGIGTIFHFTIPYALGVAAEADGTVQARNQEFDQKLLILLAEDQPMNQMVAVDTLETLFKDIVVEVANNGKEAVDMALAKKYDLVFMDVHMPEMDGYEATQLIRSGTGPNAGTPIIALTANVIKEEIDKCIDCGMNVHLAKPFDPVRLKETIVSFFK
jgi:signal transduction histidine kinase